MPSSPSWTTSSGSTVKSRLRRAREALERELAAVAQSHEDVRATLDRLDPWVAGIRAGLRSPGEGSSSGAGTCYLPAMLIACPECAHEVSDRAAACPRCGFPIATHVAEQRSAEAAATERTTRRLTGDETDCAPCKGRGFQLLEWTDDEGTKKQGFEWCIACNETGRRPVVHSSGGYWSVSTEHVEAFVRGALPTDSPHVTALGPEPPPPPSYPAKGPPAGGGSGTSRS